MDNAASVTSATLEALFRPFGRTSGGKILLEVAACLPEGGAAGAEPGGRDIKEMQRGDERKILVVDDDPMVRKFLQIVLEKAGYAVVTAGDGMEALDMVAEHDPWLILSDVIMPRLNGSELFMRLKSVHYGGKFVFISGYSQGSLAEKGLAHDDVNYLRKPITRDDLLQTVRTAQE